MEDKQKLLIKLDGLRAILLNENSHVGAGICKDAIDYISNQVEPPVGVPKPNPICEKNICANCKHFERIKEYNNLRLIGCGKNKNRRIKMEEKIAEIIRLGMMVYREEDIAKGIARDICKQLKITETKAIPIEPPVKPEIADIKRDALLSDLLKELLTDFKDGKIILCNVKVRYPDSSTKEINYPNKEQFSV